jgi:magnesium-transporting ATPase (P-type)
MITLDITNLILGALGGSIGTLIIKEIINQINRKIDFNRDIKKLTYVRKLEKAESAIAYYWTYLNKVIEVKKSFEIIIKVVNEIDESEKDIEIIQDTLDQNSKILAELAGDKYFDVNGIHLYFDLEDENEWSEEDLGEMVGCISEAKYHDNEIQLWASLHNKHLDKNEEHAANYYWEKVKEVLPKYVNSLQNFIDLLQKNRLATYSIIKKIKKQLN